MSIVYFRFLLLTFRNSEWLKFVATHSFIEKTLDGVSGSFYFYHYQLQKKLSNTNRF